MPYFMAELDMSRPLPAMALPRGYDGMAIVLRRGDAPVGFVMHAAEEGTNFSSVDLRALIESKAEMDPFSSPTPSTVQLPSLTVAVCTHNRSEVLERCLRHLVALVAVSGTDLEVLVVDNAPPDMRTRDMVAAFPHVRYVCERRQGLDFARNRAIRECGTALLAFIDDDAVVDRFWIAGIRRALTENSDAAAITGPVLPWELLTEPQIMLERRGGFGHNFRKRRITRWQGKYPYGFGAGCNMIFRRDALVAVSGFDEALDNKRILGGDTDIFYRLVQAGYVLVVDPGVLVFHQHRRDYGALRRQMRLWGSSTMALMVKTLIQGRGNRHEVLDYMYRRLRFLLYQFLLPGRKRNPAFWPRELLAVELWGSLIGLLGEYSRSKRHVAHIRAMCAPEGGAS